MIAVFGDNVDAQRTEVVFVDVATGKETTHVAGGAYMPQGLAWLGPNDLLLSQPKTTGSHVQLWRMSYPGGAVTPLTNDLSSYVGADITRDRTSVVTSRSDTRAAIWVGDAAGTQGTDVTSTFPISVLLTSVAWAGDRVLYSTTVNGVAAIASVIPGRGAPVDVVIDAALPAVTPDGKTVVYIKSSEDGTGLWKIDAQTGARPVQFEKGSAFFPVVTPDNRNVVFISPRGGRQTPWIVPIDGGEAKEIVHAFASAFSLDVSRDGRRVLFQTSDSQNRFKFAVCDLPDCANRIDLNLPANVGFGATRFTTDGHAVAYVDSSGSNLWAQPIRAVRRGRLRVSPIARAPTTSRPLPGRATASAWRSCGRRRPTISCC